MHGRGVDGAGAHAMLDLKTRRKEKPAPVPPQHTHVSRTQSLTARVATDSECAEDALKMLKMRTRANDRKVEGADVGDASIGLHVVQYVHRCCCGAREKGTQQHAPCEDRAPLHPERVNGELAGAQVDAILPAARPRSGPPSRCPSPQFRQALRREVLRELATEARTHRDVRSRLSLLPGGPIRGGRCCVLGLLGRRLPDLLVRVRAFQNAHDQTENAVASPIC